ncbi:hypothetical protein PFISCL1PPCAC_25305, partial [Pristionchus fissidentatus]
SEYQSTSLLPIPVHFTPDQSIVMNNLLIHGSIIASNDRKSVLNLSSSNWFGRYCDFRWGA